ncbi:hypothetical protein [Massilia sp. 9096]|uniref:hypothetical protein n=1 Tax=Massilia sp. 9096 TaxID=1500894 RepID=UPI00056428C0|nr:hypothetical protein [Massilia sp. 9096]
MKISIGHRLFASVLLAILAVAAGAVFLLRQNVLASFGEYAVGIELDRLDELSSDLLRRYRSRGGWDFIQSNARGDWIARELDELQQARAQRAGLAAPHAPGGAAPPAPPVPPALPAPPAHRPRSRRRSQRMPAPLRFRRPPSVSARPHSNCRSSSASPCSTAPAATWPDATRAARRWRAAR